MRRVAMVAAAVLTVALAVPALVADVKTTEKSTFKMEGFLGRFVNKAMGGDAGLTSNIALKGNRLLRLGTSDGMIIDLTEEKVYDIDVKKKEYTVMTFADMRAQMEKARAEAAKQQEQMDPEAAKAAKEKPQDTTKQLDYDVSVKETGQRKKLLDYDTKEVVLEIAVREKGKTLEQSGGMVLTSTMWLAPKIASLDELGAFYQKAFKAMYGTAFDAQQLAAVSAMMPGFAQASERLATEMKKIQGTPLATTTVFDTVKSAEQMKGAEDQKSSGGGGGGGLSGALARRMMGNKGGGETKARSTMLTMTNEYTSIGTSVGEADVALPAGLKLVKAK